MCVYVRVCACMCVFVCVCVCLSIHYRIGVKAIITKFLLWLYHYRFRRDILVITGLTSKNKGT